MPVELTEAEWNQVISVLAQAPWNVANPLLVRITQQLQAQKGGSPIGMVPAAGIDRGPPPDGSGERH
jgi:hypothetical protein